MSQTNKRLIIMRNKKINNQWVASVRRLLPVINILHLRSPGLNVDKLVALVLHMQECMGDRNTIRKLKSFRLAFQQYCLRQTVTEIPFCKTDRDGLPKCLSFVKPDRTNRFEVMYSLSVLRLIEEFKSQPLYEVETITSDSCADENVLAEILDYIRSRPKILSVLPTEIWYARLLLSNKAGPNGPASITSLLDLASLQAQGGKLWTSIERRLAKYAGQLNLAGYTIPSGEYKHSKLVLLSDKACKTRVIAIADWWSNSMLSNLHDVFMKALARLPGDVTYIQDKIPQRVVSMGLDLYSSDMTAFTDRFPRIIGKTIIEVVYGAEEAEDWDAITTDREFYHANGSVRYKVGSPMGMLSTWAINTFAHHIVKHWCANKLGIRNYQYLILGDDTLDTNRDVYNLYINTIKALGVSISTSKCTSSESGYAEFAKRLFSPDGEVTGLPVHLLDGLSKSPEQLIELIRICRSRGYEDDVLGPGIEVLLSKGFVKNPKMVADILSLPESITGCSPLKGVTPSRYIDLLAEYGETYQLAALKIARDHLFWRLCDMISLSHQHRVSPVEINNNHPIVFSLNEKCDAYLPAEAFCDDTWEEDEYWIYNQWMEGEYRHLVMIPSVDTYKYYNKGHRVTKCKFDVARLILKLVQGDCNIPLTPRTKRTNQELYDIALESITPKRNDRIAVVTTFT